MYKKKYISFCSKNRITNIDYNLFHILFINLDKRSNIKYRKNGLSIYMRVYINIC